MNPETQRGLKIAAGALLALTPLAARGGDWIVLPTDAAPFFEGPIPALTVAVLVGAGAASWLVSRRNKTGKSPEAPSKPAKLTVADRFVYWVQDAIPNTPIKKFITGLGVSLSLVPLLQGPVYGDQLPGLNSIETGFLVLTPAIVYNTLNSLSRRVQRVKETFGPLKEVPRKGYPSFLQSNRARWAVSVFFSWIVSIPWAAAAVSAGLDLPKSHFLMQGPWIEMGVWATMALGIKKAFDVLSTTYRTSPPVQPQSPSDSSLVPSPQFPSPRLRGEGRAMGFISRLLPQSFWMRVTLLFAFSLPLTIWTVPLVTPFLGAGLTMQAATFALHFAGAAALARFSERVVLWRRTLKRDASGGPSLSSSPSGGKSETSGRSPAAAYQRMGQFLEFNKGSSYPYQGIKFHISAPRANFAAIEKVVSEILLGAGASHKIVAPDFLELFVEGDPAGAQNGKFITVWPANPKEAKSLMEAIDKALIEAGIENQDIGPDSKILPPDFRWGRSGWITWRYGQIRGHAVAGMPVFWEDGTPIPDGKRLDDYLHDASGHVIKDQEGRPVPDDRSNPQSNIDAMTKAGALAPDEREFVINFGGALSGAPALPKPGPGMVRTILARLQSEGFKIAAAQSPSASSLAPGGGDNRARGIMSNVRVIINAMSGGIAAMGPTSGRSPAQAGVVLKVEQDPGGAIKSIKEIVYLEKSQGQGIAGPQARVNLDEAVKQYNSGAQAPAGMPAPSSEADGEEILGYLSYPPDNPPLSSSHPDGLVPTPDEAALGARPSPLFSLKPAGGVKVSPAFWVRGAPSSIVAKMVKELGSEKLTQAVRFSSGQGPKPNLRWVNLWISPKTGRFLALGSRTPQAGESIQLQLLVEVNKQGRPIKLKEARVVDGPGAIEDSAITFAPEARKVLAESLVRTNKIMAPAPWWRGIIRNIPFMALALIVPSIAMAGVSGIQAEAIDSWPILLGGAGVALGAILGRKSGSPAQPPAVTGAVKVKRGAASATQKDIREAGRIFRRLDPRLQKLLRPAGSLSAPLTTDEIWAMPRHIAAYLNLPFVSQEFEGRRLSKTEKRRFGSEVWEVNYNGKPAMLKILTHRNFTGAGRGAGRPAFAYDEFIQEVKGARLYERLGMGAKFHGVVDLGYGRLAYLVDKIEGDIPELMGHAITEQTLQDVSDMIMKLFRAGFINNDFQYMVTPAGRAVAIDPELLEPIRVSSEHEMRDIEQNLQHQIVYEQGQLRSLHRQETSTARAILPMATTLTLLSGGSKEILVLALAFDAALGLAAILRPRAPPVLPAARLEQTENWEVFFQVNKEAERWQGLAVFENDENCQGCLRLITGDYPAATLRAKLTKIFPRYAQPSNERMVRFPPLPEFFQRTKEEADWQLVFPQSAAGPNAVRHRERLERWRAQEWPVFEWDDLLVQWPRLFELNPGEYADIAETAFALEKRMFTDAQFGGDFIAAFQETVVQALNAWADATQIPEVPPNLSHHLARDLSNTFSLPPNPQLLSLARWFSRQGPFGLFLAQEMGYEPSMARQTFDWAVVGPMSRVMRVVLSNASFFDLRSSLFSSGRRFRRGSYQPAAALMVVGAAGLAAAGAFFRVDLF
ncbi:MAG: hypothetical protein HY547_04885, partial [Elusimicrobia bacterium]|nr:hypothetical protein [Elusimicrobiota bacterium]